MQDAPTASPGSAAATLVRLAAAARPVGARVCASRGSPAPVRRRGDVVRGHMERWGGEASDGEARRRGMGGRVGEQWGKGRGGEAGE